MQEAQISKILFSILMIKLLHPDLRPPWEVQVKAISRVMRMNWYQQPQSLLFGEIQSQEKIHSCNWISKTAQRITFGRLKTVLEFCLKQLHQKNQAAIR